MLPDSLLVDTLYDRCVEARVPLRYVPAERCPTRFQREPTRSHLDAALAALLALGLQHIDDGHSVGAAEIKRLAGRIAHRQHRRCRPEFRGRLNELRDR